MCFGSGSQFVFILVFLMIYVVSGQYRGQRCWIGRQNQRGRCIVISRCPFARELLQQNIHPQLCGFAGREPIVCCPRTAQNISRPPPPAVPIEVQSISKQKCEEYTNDPRTDPKNDELQPSITVVGGVRASASEFPHMAALGFGDENDIQWLCGGTLISENFVLTAAHCLFSQGIGDVRYIRLGDLDLKRKTDDAKPQDFRVISIHKHPEYKPPEQYNDIALLQLDRYAVFTKYVKPACLQTNYNVPEDVPPIATGWGRLGFVEETSDQLMKVNLSYFSIDRCTEAYENVPQRRLPNGITDESQICAGGITESKDTCQGDSGGPLQIKTSNDPMQYYVIGITSFGKGCGVINTPGVYTRVSNYIPWIESIVWTTDSIFIR